MKILLTGATGFVGTELTKQLEAAGHEVAAVSRGSAGAYNWSEDSLRAGVEASDAVVHLAGENIFAKRWNARQKQELWASRVDTTQRLAQLVAARKPDAFVVASAIGYYGDEPERELNEESPAGSDFLARLCVDWEAAAAPAADAGVRTCNVRIGVVLGPGGGALARMLPPFKLGLGGPIGHGRQWMSWIHLGDLVQMIRFVLESDSCKGAYNGTAPNPVTMRDLATTLGKVLKRPTVFPVPAPVLRVALGEAAGVLLGGQRVVPKRALDAGFTFEHADLEGALREILGKREPVAV